MAVKVLIIGGAGVFGSRLARLLARDGAALVIAGRDGERAARLAKEIGAKEIGATKIGAEALVLDRSGDLGPLARAGADLVIDAAGPFRTDRDDPYRVARAALEAGADYLDLADDPAFVEGIAALDDEARARGRFALSGASSTPGLSSAVVDELARGMTRIEAIDCAISPGNRAPRGLAVVARVLDEVGSPRRVFRGGAWREARGWTDRARLEVANGAARDVFFFAAPDGALFPERYGARSVVFRAGVELGVMNWGLRALAEARRLWPNVGRSARFGRALHELAAWLEPFGGDVGHMRVAVTGIVDGRARRRIWTLTATRGEGPFTPCVVARALARRREAVPPGARPCLGDAPLAAIEAACADLALDATRVEEAATPLFERILGDRFQALAPEARVLHQVFDEERFEGEAEVTRGDGLFAAAIARVFGFPAAGAAVEVRVLKTKTARGEIWERRFADKVFRSHLEEAGAPQRFLERFGPFAFEIDLPIDAGAMRLPVRRGWFLGVPLPRPLLPASDSAETVEDGRFRFDVALGAPLGGGMIVRYRGWLAPTSPRDGAHG